jgi:hypothetical protein
MQSLMYRQPLRLPVNRGSTGAKESRVARDGSPPHSSVIFFLYIWDAAEAGGQGEASLTRIYFMIV